MDDEADCKADQQQLGWRDGSAAWMARRITRRISSLDGVADQQLGWRGGSAAWMARRIAWRISSLDGEADRVADQQLGWRGGSFVDRRRLVRLH